MKISVKFPKHPNVLELEKLQTHLPFFAHFFKAANLKIKDLEATSFFSPIGAEVDDYWELLWKVWLTMGICRL